MQIDLERSSWQVGPPLPGGVGGFGTVYTALGPDGQEVVAKFVPKGDGAARELLFSDLTTAARCRNVVPILDRGEHENSYVLMMPKADRSLRVEVTACGGPMEVRQVLSVLQDIATALSDLAGSVVHRDLKPENILFLDGAWCLADFGIARYADSTTSPNTNKYAMTHQYAAPEQWKAERATSATDVYAFGITAYELLAGHRPFRGPDFRSQHLNEMPPPLGTGTRRLQTLIEECLYKAPQSRPPAHDLVERVIRSATDPLGSGASLLAQANQQEVTTKAEYERRKEGAQTEAERRAELGQSAAQGLNAISAELLGAIRGEASAATIEDRGSGAWVATLGRSRLKFDRGSFIGDGEWVGPFDVIFWTTVSVDMDSGQHDYKGRSHALWFCDAVNVGEYAWFETAFMSLVLGNVPLGKEPFALAPTSDAAMALNAVMHTVQVARRFEKFDLSDLTGFVDRWLRWFGEGALGQLSRPMMLPEGNPQGSWRARG